MSGGIQAMGMTKIYHDPERGDVAAAKDITFACSPGEVFGILGPNGAGKTTTLRMLATVIQPTTGTAVVNGFDVKQQPDQVRASIGYLSSSTGLYPRLSAVEILQYFGRLHRVPRERLAARIEEVIQELGMDDFRDTRVEHLSTGMKQKVSIGRTILHDPPVLILDEPTAGLDILVALTTMEFIKRNRDLGRTIVFSTHVMSEAEKLCDRIAIIDRGRILAIGTLAELRELTGQRYLEDVFIHLVRSNEG
jgi:sodium transport system ATP-binding protein